jgi:hypothetical protein
MRLVHGKMTFTIVAPSTHPSHLHSCDPPSPNIPIKEASSDLVLLLLLLTLLLLFFLLLVVVV